MTKYCFVPGCKTSFRSNRLRKPGEKHLALFSAPKDPVLRKQWHIASRRGDREMTVKDVMCELHFTEDCIEKYYTTELYDGQMFKLERGRPSLKKDSVPTIFSFSESNLVSKRGRPKKLCTVQNKEKGSGDVVIRKNSPASKSTRQVVCLAYGCTNSSYKILPGISFHRFPTNKTRRKAWITAVGRKDWQPSSESVLCSAHFTPDQIELTRSSVRLKPGAIPTIFSFGEKQQMNRLPTNLQTDFSDSSDLNRYESYSTEIADIPVQDSDDSELPLTETDCFVQEENDEISEEVSLYKNKSSKYFSSKNLIVEGHEEVFGKFVANELKILSCDPPLYLRTMEKIWQLLEETSQKHVY